MKRIISLLLSIAMILSFAVFPASAAGEDVILKITPDKTAIDTSAGDVVVEYTISVEVKDSSVKIGAMEFGLNPPAGMTLPTKFKDGSNSLISYINKSEWLYDSEEETGIFQTFEYTPSTKIFIASGTTADRNLHENKNLMKIRVTVAQGTSGSLTLTDNLPGKLTTFVKVDGINKWSHTVETTPVTILKAPIASVTASVKAPEAGKALDFAGTVDTSARYSISKVEWFEGTSATGTPVTGTAATAKANQFYYARITLTANSGETFAESLGSTITTSGDYSVARNSETELYLTKVYETGSLPEASVIDAPTAKSGLKYDGTEKELLGFMGNASGGTMKYSLDGSTWIDIPKGTDAKTYTVYYMVKGDSGHSDSAVASISAKIDPKDISTATIGTIAGQPYTGSAITPDLEVKDGTATLEKDKDYTVSCTDIYVGNATLTITGTGNYTGEKTGVNFNIVAADQKPTFNTPVNLVKGGQLDLSTLVSDAKGDVSFTIPPTATIATLSGNTLTAGGITGDVKVSVSITEKDMNGDHVNEYNAYSKSDAITVNVVEKTQASVTTAPTPKTDLKYTGDEQELVTKGTANGGTMQYSLGSSPWSTEIPTAKDAATYTVQYKAVGDSYHTDSTPVTLTVTIDPREVTVSGITAENKKYDGNTGATVNTSGATFGGKVDGDELTVSVAAGSTFDSADVGSRTVTLDTLTLGGTSVGNYTLAATGNQTTTTASITQRDLTVTPDVNQSKKFGDADPTMLSFMPTGAVSTQTPSFTGKLSRAEGENVGLYDITLGTLAMTDNDSYGFKASNYELKMVSPAVKFEITKADAPTLENITLSQKYNVTTEQSKDIGTAGMPEDAGPLTYRAGSPSVTTGTATVSNFTVDSTTGMVKYTITGGAAGAVIKLPVVIESTNYADATANVVITLTKPSSSGGTSYAITVEKAENGTVSADRRSASKGSTVTITVKPDKGYELDALKVLDKNGDKVKLTEKNGKYTFTMPAGKVTVKGSFVEETPVQIFKDVPVDAYYYEAVKWAAEKGITGGVGNGLFAPDQPCTRGQIVTFLWRAAGSPAPKSMSSFADVPADAFYAKAVAWAVENGITSGTGDGKFSPDATCTRAQAVTFLYRAAGSPKVSGSAEFGDVATNAYYADAVAWAAKNGITGGIGGGLFGSDNDCTRAQIVTFLYRSVK